MIKKDKAQIKETALDLGQFLNKEVNVEFNGGRRVKGILRSYDNKNNLILDNVIEYFSSEQAPTQSMNQSRQLGFVFARGIEV